MPSVTQYDDYFAQAAAAYKVDENLLKAVAKTESNFNPNAKSGAGAVGIMQLMPATAAYLGVADRYDPQQNINGGAKYLSELLDKYDGDENKALAAYNTGSGTVDNYGITQQGQTYVDTVKKNLGNNELFIDTLSDTDKQAHEVEAAKKEVKLTDPSTWSYEGGIVWWLVKILLIIGLAFLAIFFLYKSTGNNAISSITSAVTKLK